MPLRLSRQGDQVAVGRIDATDIEPTRELIEIATPAEMFSRRRFAALSKMIFSTPNGMDRRSKLDEVFHNDWRDRTLLGAGLCMM
ncbi:hypothetical protein EFR84_12255 [Rhizobium chutanense]|uniref:Uncharacterized protein n=1 Tax=Rhizobium chutanense TaxID=2035448 RepID=A0A432P316_9HYPH|nr:hypothetical protein EFR84_12255 [Rhizobium chutanense]